MYNVSFWRRYFQSMFKSHLERTLQVLEQRLLPTFDGIEAEAAALQEKTYNELMSMPLDSDVVDESMLAESAFVAGYEHYSGMEAVRQSLVNSFAPMLYHTWEQQLLVFHRKEVLQPKEANDNNFLKLLVLRVRLADNGLDVAQLPTWSRIDELRLVANTVKHADGDSADRLKTQRPEFFEPHRADGRLTAMPFRYALSVYRPMSGEDLYLTMTDIQAYGRATIEFWGEFADALERA
ncbi:hypothetical protein [Ralstonia mojiangensis]|uniref:hypothetical protein n=1 Tax=Ralstonia mojiangensis TaxID=2953895 RepID=UPI0021B3BA04|nr:hypothetical protein [Ralstonia mojiangensis]MCT7325022.1 hypothetical protein [Ralstonia mojiangensis]